MRLIDADKLEEELHSFFGDYSGKTWFNIRNILGEAEEIKAIPIELIEKEMKRLDDDIKWAWYYGNVALDKMEYLKMWLTLKLEDWDKENDKS